MKKKIIEVIKTNKDKNMKLKINELFLLII